MKAILEFNLPDEQYEHSDALHGSDWKSVAHGMDEQLRNWLKYGCEFATASEALEAARDFLYTAVDGYGLRLDE